MVHRQTGASPGGSITRKWHELLLATVMRELKPLLITYSRSRPSTADGLCQSLAETEKKILDDITNLQNRNLGLLGRKPISLHSPATGIPGKIRIRDESIHSGFVSLPSELDRDVDVEIFEDEPKAKVPETGASECAAKVAPSPSSDVWSPSKIANDSGLPSLSIRRGQRCAPRARRRPSPPPRPDNVEPTHLVGYVWLCGRRLTLSSSSAADHFGAECSSKSQLFIS